MHTKPEWYERTNTSLISRTPNNLRCVCVCYACFQVQDASKSSIIWFSGGIVPRFWLCLLISIKIQVICFYFLSKRAQKSHNRGRLRLMDSRKLQISTFWFELTDNGSSWINLLGNSISERSEVRTGVLSGAQSDFVRTKNRGRVLRVKSAQKSKMRFYLGSPTCYYGWNKKGKEMGLAWVRNGKICVLGWAAWRSPWYQHSEIKWSQNRIISREKKTSESVRERSKKTSTKKKRRRSL